MSFLIPIGVVCYAAIGGLKATFTTSYMHTVIIYIVCLVLMFKVGMIIIFSRTPITSLGCQQSRAYHQILPGMIQPGPLHLRTATATHL